MEFTQHSRHIKRTAVERDQQFDIIQEGQEFVQVLTADKGLQSAPVQATNQGDFTVPRKPGGFNIKKSRRVKEMTGNAPKVLGVETLQESLYVRSNNRLFRAFDLRQNFHMEFDWQQNILWQMTEIIPSADAGQMQLLQPFRSKTGQMP